MYKFDYTKPLLIGNQVAENDWDTLKDHFVPIGTSDFVGIRNTSLILGRKGAGKSALRLHFERSNAHAVSLQPSSEDLKSIYEYLVDHGNSIFAVEPLELLWDLAVLLNLTRICRNPDKPFKEPSVPEGIRNDINAGQRFGLGRTLTLLKETFKSDKERNDLGRSLRDHVESVTNPDIPYFVLIDSVDDILHNSFDTSKRNDLFATFLEALVNFCRNFTNKERNKLATRVYLQVFIPLDLYSWCIDRHADHLRQYKHNVRWSYENLNEFAALRLGDNIRPALRPKTHAEIWRAFFPDTVEFTGFRSSGERYAVTIPVDEALISMTLMRPRDLQEIIRQIDTNTKAAKLTFPSSDIIRRALQVYSNELYESVVNEYSTGFPNLGQVLSRLAHNNAVMPRDVLYDLVGRVVGHKEGPIQAAIKLLYEAGVLGMTSSERHSPDDTFFAHTFENTNLVYESKFFAVHRAFWHALRVDSLSPRPERSTL